MVWVITSLQEPWPPWESWRQLRVPHSPSMWLVEKRPSTSQRIAHSAWNVSPLVPIQLCRTRHRISARFWASSPQLREFTRGSSGTDQSHPPDRRAFTRHYGGSGRIKGKNLSAEIVRAQVSELEGISDQAKEEFCGIIDQLPMAYSDVTAIFRLWRKKSPGNGELFSIFVSDLCKGCGECVQVCGDHDALRMTAETESLNAS